MNDTNHDFQKQSRVYLLLVYAVCFGLGGAALLTKNETGNPVYGFLQRIFTAVPILAALAARRITHDKGRWNFSLRVWKRPGLWAFCAFCPDLLIALGAAVFFIEFPEKYSGVFDYGALTALTGVSGSGVMAVHTPIVFWAAAAAISAIFIPIQLLELGEEIGWREYLFPRQIEQFGIHKAVLLNSFLWGIAHLPLIYFGFNYSAANPGAPWSNMAMMMLMCLAVGVICCYVTAVSGNAMFAAIVHGVVNIIGEIPVFLSLRQENSLLGPNPTGLIGMAGLILCAMVLFTRLGKIKNRLIADPGEQIVAHGKCGCGRS